MRRDKWLLAITTAYALIVIPLFWGGFVRNFIIYPFLLTPPLLTQVYFLFYCPRRTAPHDRAFHIVALIGIGVAIVALFYLSTKI